MILVLWMMLQEPAREPAKETVATSLAAIAEVRGVVLDALTGAPVAGASLELWSEELDQPAVLGDRTVSGPDGRYVLARRARDQEKIRVRADGYRSTVVYAHPERSVYLFSQGEPFRLRILDLDGNPIAGARVRSHQSCRHAPPAVEAVSDAEGRIAIQDAPPISDGAEYEIRAPGYGALLRGDFDAYADETVIHLPRRAAVRVRLIDATGATVANRRFLQQGPVPTIVVTDRHGRATLESLFESREIGLRDAAKELGWFGGIPPPDGEVLVQEEHTLPDPFPPDGWPTLVVVPEYGWSAVHVQCGEDSWTFSGGSGRLNSTRPVHVPPGSRVTVLEQGRDVRRIELEPWHGARELDMETAPVIRPAAVEPPPVALAFRVLDASGEPLAVEAFVYWEGPDPEDEDPSLDGVLFRLPEGVRYEARFSAEGHACIHRVGRARESAAPEEVRLPALTETGHPELVPR